MWNKKAFVWALIVALVALGVYFVFSRYLVSKLDGTGGVTAPAGTGVERYDAQSLGMSFEYPSTRYDIQTPAQGVVVLVPEGYVPPQNGEGPTAITIQALNNAEGLPLDVFLQNEPKTNYSLANGTATPTVVGGEQALAYQHGGLYENDAVAVKHGTKVYLFSASWMDATSEIRQDFQTLLKSVTFK